MERHPLVRASLVAALVLAAACGSKGGDAPWTPPEDEDNGGPWTPGEDPGTSCGSWTCEDDPGEPAGDPGGTPDDPGGSAADPGGTGADAGGTCSNSLLVYENWCETAEDCCYPSGMGSPAEWEMRCIPRYPHGICVSRYRAGCDEAHTMSGQFCLGDADCCTATGVLEACHPVLRRCYPPCGKQPGDYDPSGPIQAFETEKCCGGYVIYGKCSPVSCLANGERLHDAAEGYGLEITQCGPGGDHFHPLCCSRWCEMDGSGVATCANPPCSPPATPCSADADCCSGRCVNSLCDGKANREPCRASSECASGRCEEDLPMRSARCQSPPCEDRPFYCVDCVAPECGPNVCGDVGCGKSCGACPEGDRCLRNLCCTPDCALKECGEDGCGGWCPGATCGPDQVCYEGACCTPNCAGRCGGHDGCGNLCPAVCPEGQGCVKETCCTPDCSGRECGASCGKLCGTCPPGKACDGSGHCIAGACAQNGQSCATTACCDGLACSATKTCLSCGKLDDDCNSTYGCCAGLSCIASGGPNKKCWFSGCIYGCDPRTETCIPGGCAVQ